MLYLKSNRRQWKFESQSMQEVDFLQDMLLNKKVLPVASAGFSQWLPAAHSVPTGACCSTAACNAVATSASPI